MSSRPSAHFSWSEFRAHGTTHLAGRHRPAVKELCTRYLEPLRREFGAVTVHSGNRGPIHNTNVGGAPHSFHIYSQHPGTAAADISCERGSVAQWVAFLEALDPPPGGLGRYSTHIHVDTRIHRARW